jgi:hypothetical protein
MNTHITIHERLRLHDRDVALLGRLFADWTRARDQRNTEAHRQLDAIEVQLAKLERSVGMVAPPVRRAAATTKASGGSRAAICLAIQQS